MPRKTKTELENLLSASIKLAREGKLPKRDALGQRLRDLDPDLPTSLDDPDKIVRDESEDW